MYRYLVLHKAGEIDHMEEEVIAMDQVSKDTTFLVGLENLEEKDIRSLTDKNLIPGCVPLKSVFLTDLVMSDFGRKVPPG